MAKKQKAGNSCKQGTGEKTNWATRNPVKALILTVLLLTLLIDLIAGLLFIPVDYNVFRCPHHFYHHDLLPNREKITKWGNVTYPIYTNSLGFRDGRVRTIPARPSHKRILIIGDSFTEGLGVLYEETFAGLLDRELQKNGIEVLNAGVISYSPKLYYLKIKYLVSQQGLDFDQLFVFIDTSDIQNEIAYENFEPRPFNRAKKILFHLKKFLKKTSFFYYALSKLFNPPRDPLLGQLAADGIFPCLHGVDERLMNDRNFRRVDTRWTLDDNIFAKVGRKGLSLAMNNMSRLVELCREKNIDLTIVVYPWPVQVRHRDLESIQVKSWHSFARENGIGFINLFPDFINERDTKEIIKTYFIPMDSHWNVAGHRLVADKVLEYIQSRDDN